MIIDVDFLPEWLMKLLCKIRIHTFAYTRETLHVGRHAIPRRIRVCVNRDCGIGERFNFNAKTWVRLKAVEE